MTIYELLRLLVLRPNRMTAAEMGAALTLIQGLENVAAFGTITTNTSVEVNRQNTMTRAQRDAADAAEFQQLLELQREILERMQREQR